MELYGGFNATPILTKCSAVKPFMLYHSLVYKQLLKINRYFVLHSSNYRHIFVLSINHSHLKTHSHEQQHNQQHESESSSSNG